VSEFRANYQPLVAAGKIEHHVADMTATIAADVSLAQVQQALAAMGQWLPIDGDADLPVGELVETNSSGPLRLGYGHWRDLLLGAQFHNGVGELITAGGRTVKNVAGYDLTKFMIGQRGVFGRLVTLTTRTYKRPAGAILATFSPNPKLIDQLIPSPARPQWAMLTSDALLCGYLSDERTLAYYSGALAQWKPISIKRRTLETDIEQRASLWQGEFRAAVPPAQLKQFLADAKPAQWVADPVFGIVLGAGVDDAMVEKAARDRGGSVVFTVRGKEKFFTVPPGPQREALERLKKSFDPDNRLSPLPWQIA
jgi:FAD/FMN-containing dehydrogenase